MAYLRPITDSGLILPTIEAYHIGVEEGTKEKPMQTLTPCYP